MDNIHQINFNKNMGQIVRVAAFLKKILGVLGELWRKINLFFRRNLSQKAEINVKN